MTQGPSHRPIANDKIHQMTGSLEHLRVGNAVRRRRRWSAAEKRRIAEETFEAGATVKSVAMRYQVAPNQISAWRRVVTKGPLGAPGRSNSAATTSDYEALQGQVRELQRLLGRKTLEVEVLRDVLEHAIYTKRMPHFSLRSGK